MKKITLPDSHYALSKQITISSYHADMDSKLTIPSIFILCQEIAWEHATLNGFGYKDLKVHNSFWILSRIHIEIDELPKWAQSVNLTSWPSGIEGPFALRDFILRNGAGKTLITATSSWVIVDATTRRPKRPDTFKNTMPICSDIRATETNAPRIRPSQGETVAEIRHKVGICDLDINNHINNVKYTEWALNLMPYSEYKEKTVCCIDVNYLSEGFYNDICIHKLERTDDKCLLGSIIREEDGKVLALVSFTQRR